MSGGSLKTYLIILFDAKLQLYVDNINSCYQKCKRIEITLTDIDIRVDRCMITNQIPYCYEIISSEYLRKLM